MNYERHQISASWPDMNEEDFLALKDSIEVSGLREPIVLFEEMILDGWHRYKACIEIGFPIEFQEFSDTDPVQYVLDKHTRRPLSLTQRMTAIALMHSWRPRGKPSKSAPGADLTSAQLAKAAGGSVRTAEQVKEAITKGSIALVDGMKSGKTSAKKAAAVAKLPKDQQAEAIDRPLPKLAFMAEDEDPISILSEENDRLNDRLAVVAMDATPEERAAAGDTIAGLRSEVKTLTATLAAVTASRDSYMAENSELKRQCASQKKQLDKLKK